ncbi:mitochondrial import inner membrane translocase subunit Tim29 [Zonotrichia leucophrys gambelii]|uniref:mitochondrial import inner membrane translocase subunit Tim29 n=1 Tax=Zonotrichia leucophrys gambelii TaxID=257770 RepID=UPI00314094F8
MAAEAAAGGAGRGLWGRLGDTRLGLWLRALLRDYSSSLREAAASARRRPALAAASLSALALGAALARSVPDRGSLEAAAVAAGAALGELPPGSRSPRAERHVQRLLRLRERHRIRVRSFGIVAVAGTDPNGAEPALYRARCPHLRPRPWDRGALLDLGFLGRWWLLEAALRDCDINEEEFGALPEPLRRLEPGALRSERNERLHRESRAPVLLSEADIGDDGQ